MSILLLYPFRLKASAGCGQFFKFPKKNWQIYLKRNTRVWATQERTLPRNSIPVIQTTSDDMTAIEWPDFVPTQKGLSRLSHTYSEPRCSDEDFDRLNLVLFPNMEIVGGDFSDIFHVTFYNQYSATVVSPETSGAWPLNSHHSAWLPQFPSLHMCRYCWLLQTLWISDIRLPKKYLIKATENANFSERLVDTRWRAL